MKKSKISLDISLPKIKEKHKSEFYFRVNIHNIKRLKFVSLSWIFINVGLIFFHILNYTYYKSLINFNFLIYFQILHSIVMLILYILSLKYKSNDKKENKLIWISIFSMCYWGVVCTSTNFNISNDLSAYVASLFLTSILFVTSNLLSTIVYLSSLIFILIGIYTSKINSTVQLQSQTILLIIFTIVSWVISRIYYFSYTTNFNNYTRLLDEFEEKQKALLELEDLNRRFEEIIEERSKEIIEINKKLSQQIDENKKIIEALSNSEKYYKDFIDFLPLMVLECDKEGYLKYYNKEVVNQFEIEDNILSNRFSIFNLIANENIETAKKRFENMLNRKEIIIRGERFLMQKKNKEIFPCLVYSHSIVENSEFVGIRSVIINIQESEKVLKALEASEEKYRELVENINEGLTLVDPDENIIFANKAACKIFGLDFEKLKGKNISEFTSKKEFLKIQAQTKLRKQGISTRYEIEIISADGKKKICQLTAVPRFDTNGNFIASQGLLLDITQQKLDEQKIRESEEKYRRIFENIQDVYFEISTDGIILNYSPSISYVSKYSHTELLGKSIYDIVVSAEELNNGFTELYNQKYIQDFELKIYDKDKSIKYFSTNARLIEDIDAIKIVGSLHDITKRKQIEIKIRESLKEKDVLLKEIHHRVKNNLQIIHSLLSLQAEAYSDDEIIQNIFREAQGRIKTMSLVHENLYQSKNFAKINTKDYVSPLINYVTKSYLKPKMKININAEIDNIFLNIDTAIPLGLIITEIISNSMKYAFKPNKDNELQIRLNSFDELVHLYIKDNGPGLKENYNMQNTNSLGIKLIHGLCNQISAKVNFINENGLIVMIEFPLNSNN